MVFNPSSVDRLSHVLIGALILGGFFVMSISAWYLLKGRHREVAERSFKVGLIVAAIASLGALVTGHDAARKVAETQPAKLAAFEAHFDSEGPAPLHLFGWPDAKAQEVRFGLAIPGLLSFLVHGDFETPVTGMDRIPEDERPPVWLPFQMFHLMVGLGTGFIALTWLAMFFWWRGSLFEKRWLLWVFVVAVLGPYAANEAGWIAAEVGRQPWIVYPSVQDGVEMMGLRTADGLSESVRAGHVLWSLIMFGLIYFLLFCVWVFVMNEKIKHGPESPQERARVNIKRGFLEAGAVRAMPGVGMLGADSDDPAGGGQAP